MNICNVNETEYFFYNSKSELELGNDVSTTERAELEALWLMVMIATENTVLYFGTNKYSGQITVGKDIFM